MSDWACCSGSLQYSQSAACIPHWHAIQKPFNHDRPQETWRGVLGDRGDFGSSLYCWGSGMLDWHHTPAPDWLKKCLDVIYFPMDWLHWCGPDCSAHRCTGRDWWSDNRNSHLRCHPTHVEDLDAVRLCGTIATFSRESLFSILAHRRRRKTSRCAMTSLFRSQGHDWGNRANEPPALT